jgi:CRP/FNR family cyclic AMP-dependent transcriptional regulator
MQAPSPDAVFLLPEEELQRLSARAVVRAFRKNTIVIAEGGESDALYVILAGRVRVYLANDNGKEITLNIEGPGEYFGEMALDGGHRSASVVTLEPSRFMLVPRDEVEALMASHPAFARHLVGKLMRRVRTLTETVKSLALQDVYGRLTSQLLALARDQDGQLALPEALTHQQLATRIGASREMVSRILQDLTAGGYIAVEARRIVIRRKLPLEW